MFKILASADDIATGMDLEMIKSAREDDFVAKRDAALECLNKAAELFDDLGFAKEAEVITILLEKIAG